MNSTQFGQIKTTKFLKAIILKALILILIGLEFSNNHNNKRSRSPQRDYNERRGSDRNYNNEMRGNYSNDRMDEDRSDFRKKRRARCHAYDRNC